ncbi:MAG: PepSY domain-containing protein [Cyanobacteria bacterium J06598_1]
MINSGFWQSLIKVLPTALKDKRQLVNITETFTYDALSFDISKGQKHTEAYSFLWKLGMVTRNVEPSLEQPSVTEGPSSRFYRTVWRWHFYAGLFVVPFMVMLGITGIIYLFKPQLDTAMYHNLMFVQPSGSLLPYTEQVEAVQAAYPGATVSKFIPNEAADRSAEVTVATADARSLEVFVDPYAGQVLGVRDEERNLQAIARKIHGDLLIGNWGDYLIELAACWAIVLLISGVYLWFPRRSISVMGTFIPRLWSKNKRIFWRDLHAVPGFYGVLLIGFLLITGLPWTGFWGDTFAQVWGRFPDKMWDNVPQSSLVTGSLNEQGTLFVPWAAEQMPIPLSNLPDALLPDSTLPEARLVVDHSRHGAEKTDAVSQKIPDVFNQVVATAIAQGAPPGFNITFPEGETGVYTASAFPNDPKQEITIHMDQYSGTVLASVGWKDYGLVPKAVELGVSVHMGKYFGLANQLVMLFAALVTILLAITGTVMWWKRRPKGSGLIGAPPMPPYVQNWRVPVAIVAVLGLALPLMGLSLVIVLLLDYFVISRTTILRRLFG